MNHKIFLPLIFAVFLLSAASAMTVYADFTDGTQSATIDVGESISFNVDFFSMEPPMISIKAGLYSGDNLIQSFLDRGASGKTYYNTYTYTATEAGTYKIKVIGTDNTNTDSECLTLTVHPIVPPIDDIPPVITLLGPNPQTVTKGTSYNEYEATATDDVDGDLTSEIQITGTVNTNSIGTYTKTYTVSDSAGNTATATRTVYVVCSANHAPVITSYPVTSVDEGDPYYYNVDATDSDGNVLTYSLTEAPAWLSINSATGVISGTAPSVSSNTPYSIIVRVSDGTAADTQSYTLTVLNMPIPPANHAPVIDSISEQQIDEEEHYSYHVTATDSDGDVLTYSLSYDSPGWLTINSATGVISGTAPEVDEDKDYTVKVTVSDGHGGTDTESYTLTVIDEEEEDDDEEDCASCSRIIEDNLYDKNKYLDQFNTGKITYTDEAEKKSTGFPVLILLYLLIAIIGLGIIIIVFLLIKNLRR